VPNNKTKVMYKIVIGLSLGFVLGMYSIEDFYTSRIGATAHSYECEIPFDIPDTLAGGQKIDWDCNWYAAYKDGDVFVLYYDDDTTKGAKAIVMNSAY
jgi:hypothetical protein